MVKRVRTRKWIVQEFLCHKGFMALSLLALVVANVLSVLLRLSTNEFRIKCVPVQHVEAGATYLYDTKMVVKESLRSLLSQGCK